MKKTKFIFAAWIVMVPPGCTATLKGPNLGALYERAAKQDNDLRNPVIVIPGILGSKLRDEESGRVVWGAFTGNYANPRTTDGARLVGHPMAEGVPLRDLRDHVKPDGVLDRVKVRIFGLPLELNAYLNILATLGVGGYRDELLGRARAVDYGPAHFTCFQYDYDWRRDIVESAKRLHEFVEARRSYVCDELRNRFGVVNADVKVDIVAHSMGGLVARYYLLYGNADLPEDGSLPPVTWAGAMNVERVILVGTPSAGSVKAFAQLVDGAKFAPIIPEYSPALIGTMPSVYQLMPRSRHGTVVTDDADRNPIPDLFDPQLWELRGWGLASPSEDHMLQKLLPEVEDIAQRRHIALDHQRKCLTRAKQFHAALDVIPPPPPPPGVSIHLYAADSEPTDAVVGVNMKNGGIRVLDRRPGDGTVTRASALGDERVGGAWSPGLRSAVPWSQVTFLFTDHLGLTKDAAFTDNVLYLLLENRAPRTK